MDIGAAITASQIRTEEIEDIPVIDECNEGNALTRTVEEIGIQASTFLDRFWITQEGSCWDWAAATAYASTLIQGYFPEETPTEESQLVSQAIDLAGIVVDSAYLKKNDRRFYTRNEKALCRLRQGLRRLIVTGEKDENLMGALSKSFSAVGKIQEGVYQRFLSQYVRTNTLRSLRFGQEELLIPSKLAWDVAEKYMGAYRGRSMVECLDIIQKQVEEVDKQIPEVDHQFSLIPEAYLQGLWDTLFVAALHSTCEERDRRKFAKVSRAIRKHALVGALGIEGGAASDHYIAYHIQLGNNQKLSRTMDEESAGLVEFVSRQMALLDPDEFPSYYRLRTQ